MKTSTTLGKERMKMVKPTGQQDYEEGSPAEEKAEPADEAAAEGDTGDQGGVGAEAQAVVDSIGDNHALCMAVYELLKDKYENEQAGAKKGSETSDAGDAAMSTEGMPD